MTYLLLSLFQLCEKYNYLSLHRFNISRLLADLSHCSRRFKKLDYSCHSSLPHWEKIATYLLLFRAGLCEQYSCLIWNCLNISKIPTDLSHYIRKLEISEFSCHSSLPHWEKITLISPAFPCWAHMEWPISIFTNPNIWNPPFQNTFLNWICLHQW